jgi:FkbM family methyltransferase
MHQASLSPYARKLFDNRITRASLRSIVRSAATRRWSRTILNQYYNLLDDDSRSRFHSRYAKIFRGQNGARLDAGEWAVRFLNKTIRVPLNPSSSWLDWDTAVTVVGHDIEVKQTYANLLSSNERPILFIDIGANYGTHTILFLSAGIQTISFEPNPDCLRYFQRFCKSNGLVGQWHQVALGNGEGRVELMYPQKDTWLGTIAGDVALQFRQVHELATQPVPLKKLDGYSADIPDGEILIKIDVEGYEREVLKGASLILRKHKPKIIFESNNISSRRELSQLLADFGYSVYSLPWHPSLAATHLHADKFLAASASNFIAVARP